MAKNRKPRKAYKPKAQWMSPLEFVRENLSLLCEFDPSYVLNIKIKDHSAMTAVQRGTATKRDMDNIAATYNIVFGLRRTLGLPESVYKEFGSILYHANLAFKTSCSRASDLGRVVCTADELQAFNNLVELNGELLDVVTVKQWGDALSYAKNHAKSTKPSLVNAEGVPEPEMVL